MESDMKALIVAARIGLYMHFMALIFMIPGVLILVNATHQGTFATVIAGLGLLAYGVALEVFTVWRGLYKKKYIPAVRHLSAGWDESLVEYRSHSLCERRMILYAAIQTGHEEQCRAFLNRNKVSLRWWTWSDSAKGALKNLKGRKES